MCMALMQITVIPVGTGAASVGDYVAGVIKLLRKTGVSYELGDMGTVIHGSATDLLKTAAAIHEYPFGQGAERVVTNILLDDRRDQDRAIGEKRRSVLDRLGGEQ